MDQALGRIARVMRVEAASLLLLNESTGELDFAVVKGLNAQALRELDTHLKPEEGLAGWAFAHNAAAVINDPDRDPRFKAGVDWLTGFKTWNLLAAPLRLNGRPFGVLEVVNRRKKEPFTDEDAELLSAIAHLLTTTLDNVRTVTALENAQAQFRALMENMPGGFIGVDAKGVLTHASPRAGVLLGWESIPIGRTAQEVLSTARDLQQALSQVLAEGKPLVRQSCRWTSPHGDVRVFGYTAFPLFGSSQSQLGAGLLFQDITSV
jgi:PAS domain S-box-containing protein